MVAPSSLLRQPEHMERERRVSNAGDCLNVLGILGEGGASQEEGLGQLDNKERGFSLSTLFCVCFRRSTCSPSWGTTSTSRTSPSSRSPPTPWSAPLRGLSCGTWSRGRPSPSTPSSHSRPQWWRDRGPRPGRSHCRSQTQESQQGEGARHGRLWDDWGPEGIMGNEARVAWGHHGVARSPGGLPINPPPLCNFPSRRRPQGGPQPPKLRAVEAQAEVSWKR